MKKAVIIMMVVLFSGNVFAGKACEKAAEGLASSDAGALTRTTPVKTSTPVKANG